ncbi:DegT/DnrJ/EryC1/StrS family aminotransferase [Methanoregula formicica]|uniref:Putative PLP-dependent enzyme possibly involved in cell wall biogenesis n=1 Tax=Methanoregula formicica (strain DSM 22288 / NBRC 105244 / SMSP) TaxID=593750 RepID=L0HDV8_METFS|nr:DegT/DnrJ/EryC1/StrS family aminotransferase [Methanoregula formicica]AGB01513.1 putative PLP-dependent enzyme possibly involved in cell wall biogenesis [Methanoregula formicica SMSP]
MKNGRGKDRDYPWWSPQVTPKEYELVREVLDSNYLNEGDYTTRFENEIAQLLGVKHAIAVTSGTSALFLALAALGIGPSDEVIVPDVTFIATANAVKLTGAIPVLVDIDPDTLTISPGAVESAITQRTRAIIPVHVSGRAADLNAIMSIAKKYDLFIVEDAAEAFMSSIDGKYLGTFGNAGCFSFSPNKTISTGQGGMIVTNDDDLHIILRQLKDQGRPKRGTGGDDIHYSVGYNFKLTNLQAAIGLGQLSVLHNRLQRQKEIYTIYSDHFENSSNVSIIGFKINRGEIPLWTDAIIERRDVVESYLQKMGIHCRKFWYPIHTQKPYFQNDALFSQSTQLMSKAMWLPSAFILEDTDVEYVCNQIKRFFG